MVWFLRGILVFSFLFLLGRLTELQIIKGGYFRSLAESNRVRKVTIDAPRGQIVARGGEALVNNLPVKKKIVFRADGGIEKTTEFSEESGDEIITEYERRYSLGSALAHVTGYLGEVNEKEVGMVDPRCPGKGPKRLGGLTGRSGLEEIYDCELKGIEGEELIEVDIKGNKVRILGRKEPVAGKDLKTNIDYGLQEKIASAFNGKKGAVVASDAHGEILALYSSPSFDPNLFVRANSSLQVVRILTDDNLPLFNRAVSGLYHPGSVFKPVVAITALSEGKIDKNYTFLDPGVIRVGSYSYSNWYFSQYGRTEGEIGVVRALARSTDTFFYHLGEIVGIDKIAEWAGRFGLSQKTGIDLPGEAVGLVPLPKWKEETQKEKWFLGNTYHVAIGQGELVVTPVALNTAIAVLASGGKLCQPEIVAAEVKCQNLEIKKENLDLVRAGMIGACSPASPAGGPGGTGYTFFDWGGPSTSLGTIACKTGTAETNEDGKTHAWFTLFSPAQTDDNSIVLTVLVERGGEGSKVAGPIAREIMDYWIAKGSI